MEHFIPMTDEEIEQLMEDERAEAAESWRAAGEAQIAIALKMGPVLDQVSEEWRDALAAHYPTACWMWDSEHQTNLFDNSDRRGMYFLLVGQDWLTYFAKEQAAGLLAQIADPAVRELAYDHLFEHDMKAEVVLCLQDPRTNAVATFRLPLILSESSAMQRTEA